MGTPEKTPSKWWFNSRKGPTCSPWLLSTLAELDSKTKRMLKLIEVNADSISQYAELFYKKRPELISLVEDFYRTHRSLAEKYDKVKHDHGTSKHLPGRLTRVMSQPYDRRSLSSESDVEDAEPVGIPLTLSLPNATEVNKVAVKADAVDEVVDDNAKDTEEEIVTNEAVDNELMKLREEVERLKEENRIQKEQLMQKDEEKREAIRQLSLAVEILKEDNVMLKEHTKGILMIM